MQPTTAPARAALLAEAPRYSAALHLVAFHAVVVPAVVACVALLRAPVGLAWLTGPVLFVLANAAEWRLHKSVLHKRLPLVEHIYEQHTVQHHSMFVRGDMTWDDPRLLKGILMPPYALVALLVVVTPLAAGLWLTLGRNVAAIFELSCILYFWSYEVLHLLCHVDPESLLGRGRLVRFLARHHTAHHDPRLMQRYNFNVNVPLWDLVRGTIAPAEGRSHDDEAAEAARV